jgi:hypothetical protein
VAATLRSLSASAGSFKKLVASSRGLRGALAVTGVGALGLGAGFIAANVGGIPRALDGIGPKLDKALGPQNAVMFKPVTESAQKLSDLFKTGFVLDDKTWATWVNEGIAEMARMAAQFKQTMFLITGNAK